MSVSFERCDIYCSDETPKSYNLAVIIITSASKAPVGLVGECIFDLYLSGGQTWLQVTAVCVNSSLLTRSCYSEEEFQPIC